MNRITVEWLRTLFQDDAKYLRCLAGLQEASRRAAARPEYQADVQRTLDAVLGSLEGSGLDHVRTGAAALGLYVAAFALLARSAELERD